MSSKYNERSKKVQEVKGKILWRAYQLGYDFNSFGKIDRYINRWRQNGSDQNKTEKYGSKYTWIAYCELAGYLDDNGQLKSKATAKNPVRALIYDFDPTFPEPVSERLYFEQDIIGNRNKKMNDWLVERTMPDVSPLLVVNDLTDDRHPYVLLKAFKIQTDEFAQRQIFFSINGIMAGKDQPTQLINAIQYVEEFEDLIPSIYDRIYSGEYPYSDYFPSFGKKVIDSVVKTKKVKQLYVRDALFKGNKQLSAKQEKAYWDEMSAKHKFYSSRDFTLEIKDKNGNSIRSIQVNKVTTKTKEKVWDQLLMQDLQKKGYNLRTIHKYFWEDLQVTKPVEVFMPVISWGQNRVVAKEIATALNLNAKPGSTDLFDSNGQRASLTFRYGDKYNNNHTMVYLRKDLLDEYLIKTGYRLLFIYQGERNWYMPDDNDDSDSDKPHWKTFSRTFEYPLSSPGSKRNKTGTTTQKKKNKKSLALKKKNR